MQACLRFGDVVAPLVVLALAVSAPPAGSRAHTFMLVVFALGPLAYRAYVFVRTITVFFDAEIPIDSRVLYFESETSSRALLYGSLVRVATALVLLARSPSSEPVFVADVVALAVAWSGGVAFMYLTAYLRAARARAAHRLRTPRRFYVFAFVVPAALGIAASVRGLEAAATALGTIPLIGALILGYVHTRPTCACGTSASSCFCRERSVSAMAKLGLSSSSSHSL